MAAQNLNHLEEQSELIKMFDKDKRRSIWDNVIIIVKKGRGDQDDIQVVNSCTYSFYLKKINFTCPIPKGKGNDNIPYFYPYYVAGCLKSCTKQRTGAK